MSETETSSSWQRLPSVSRVSLAQAPRRGLAAVASRWRWWLPCLLATGGALLSFHAFYAPWLVLTNTFFDGQTFHSFSKSINGDQLFSVLPYAMNRGTLLPYTLIRLTEAGLVALGLGLATFLWMRLSPLMTRLARVLLLFWSLVTTGTIVATIGNLLVLIRRRSDQQIHNPFVTVSLCHCAQHTS
jgi:hypothetical protein